MDLIHTLKKREKNINEIITNILIYIAHKYHGKYAISSRGRIFMILHSFS